MRLVASQSGHMASVIVDLGKVVMLAQPPAGAVGLAYPRSCRRRPLTSAWLGDTDMRLDARIANLSARCYDPGRRNCSDPARGQ
jgi:hypothetical protein